MNPEQVNCVLVKANGSIEQISLKKTPYKVDASYFDGKDELHMTAYYNRDELNVKDKRLYKLHTDIMLMCHEDGYYMNMPLNTKASRISGIQCLGDVIFFHVVDIEKDGEDVVKHIDLEVRDIQAMHDIFLANE
jgi:hypothetical protein